MGLISNNKSTMFDFLKNSINNSDEILMNVSFIRDSGLKLLIKYLKQAKEEGKSIKILTSDYMKVTEPNALYRLLDIGNTKIFNNTSNISFHPKTYIFKKGDKTEIFIGSSNISYSALISGVEWNYHFSSYDDEKTKDIINEFYELYEKNSFDLTLDWLRNYEKKYKKSELGSSLDNSNQTQIIQNIEPIKFQIPALYELSKTREEGYKKAMVVVGTGLGKTYLSVFDSMNFNKILFIVHRDEILRDAKKSFEKVYGNKKTYGFFNSFEKSTNSDITFASVFTLSKDSYLNENYFSKDYFDYIIVDEFHHSSSKSYLKILEYFKPKFLLGLTATPDRADNGDIYSLCDYNIAYECDFVVGINNGWLSPFEYFGIYDDTDFTPIPWRNGKYDLTSLENVLIINKRNELIYNKYLQFRKKFSIGFCASVKHCQIMNEFFRLKGIKSDYIIGETPFEKRQKIINDFKNGKIDIIFTVDIFNEGVDIPYIDTVLFLRPTNSYTIFIQQLGRGLRVSEGKDKLRVLDFVGNYRGAELKPLFLTGKYKKNRIISPVDSDFILPDSCSANFDFNLIDYFEKQKRTNTRQEQLIKNDYQSLMEKLNKIPSLMETYTFGEIPIHMYIKTFKSWYNFQKSMNVLNEEQKNYSKKAIDFLHFLETTAMTKSYKIPLFLSLFDELKQSQNINFIGEYFKSFYSNELYQKDLNNKKHYDYKNWNSQKFEKLAKENPIKFLTEKGKNSDFFTYENDNFILDTSLYNEISNSNFLLNEIKERIKYKITNYFNRKYMED